MKPKNLIPLLAILAVLVVLVIWKSTSTREPSIIEQVQLARLVPEGITPADIARIELFAGGKPDEKVVVARSVEDPDVWTVTSHFDAPAKTEKIDEYLDTLVKLKGEFRAAVDTDEALEDYNLTDVQAFHVLGFKRDAEDPAFEILAGKAKSESQVFMRSAGATDVFVLADNLRRDAGVWQDEPDAVPEAKTWLELAVVNVDKEKVTKIDIVTPDKTLVFEKREKPSAEPEAPEGETAEEEPPAEETPKPVEYEWALAQGGPGGEFKQSTLDSLLGKFGPLNATTVVDPSKKAEWGLDNPAFKVTLSLDGEEAPVVLEGGFPDPSGSGYLRVAGASPEVIYELSKWQFEPIFPKGRDLFTLTGLSVAKDDIIRVALAQPEGDVVLVKDGEDWTIESPAADLEVQKSTLSTVASTLASWSPADYADSAEAAGLDQPTRTITFTAGDETHVVAIGNDASGIDGAYVKLANSDTVLIMNRSDLDRIFVAPKDIYERTLLDIDGLDIKTITVSRAEDPFELVQGDDGWTVKAGDVESEADEEAAEDLAEAISDLQAEDIVFSAPDMGAEPYATVNCVMNDGATHTLVIGAKQDEQHPVIVAGGTVGFQVNVSDLANILPASQSLKKPEPEPVEPAPAAEGPDTEAAPEVVEGAAPESPAE